MSEPKTQRLGIVSNCWKVQLAEGQLLKDLIEEAERRRFSAVELRQGSLGEYESSVADAWCSVAARKDLSDLSSRFPSVEFDLAVSLPCFGGQLQVDDAPFARAFVAARALARDGHPHLRLVDTETRAPQLGDRAIQHVATLLATMAQRLIDVDGCLSIEHAFQSWSVFWSAFQQARIELGEAALRLRCCFDPCNLLLTERLTSVTGIVESIWPDDVSMIHLKQRANGQIQRDVFEGDLDWSLLMQTLYRHGHTGPWLFEVAPDPEVWSNLERSVRQLFGPLCQEMS